MTSPLSRRRFLRNGSTLLALPALEAFAGPAAAAPAGPRNFIAIGCYLGWHQNAFFPKEAGADYTLPPTLAPLAPHKAEFTVFSGLDHRAPNGHGAWSNFLCGRTPKSHSLDQQIADAIGQATRFHSLQLIAGAGESKTSTKAISYTRQGIPLPMLRRPSVLYKKLFVSKADRERSEYVLKSGRSTLDALVADAKRLQANLPANDRDKLGEYFESVRSVEKRIGRQLAALDEPVPEPDYKLPSYDPVTPNLQLESETLLYDLMALALETESTRVISMLLDGLGQVFSLDGRVLGAGYHGLSHHGNDPAMIRDLIAIETAHIHCFSRFVGQLKAKKTLRGTSLLDETVLWLGTGMGDASRHSNRNLPTLVAGGGFSHRGHLAIDPAAKNAPLLGDLCITVQQKLGMESDTFSNASRNLNHLFS